MCYLWKPDTAISFVRFGALWKVTKRTNAKMKFHFFVLSTCITRQNEQTTKRNSSKTSFCCVVVLSFWRLVEVGKTNKRQNEQVTTTNQTLIFRGNFVVLSFCRALEKATKRTNEEMKFHSFVLATCTTRQNEQTKERNFVFVFSRLFVLAPWPTRQNEEKKKWNSISSFWRLAQRDKTNKRRNANVFFKKVISLFLFKFTSLTCNSRNFVHIYFYIFLNKTYLYECSYFPCLSNINQYTYISAIKLSSQWTAYACIVHSA